MNYLKHALTQKLHGSHDNLWVNVSSGTGPLGKRAVKHYLNIFFNYIFSVPLTKLSKEVPATLFPYLSSPSNVLLVIKLTALWVAEQLSSSTLETDSLSLLDLRAKSCIWYLKQQILRK